MVLWAARALGRPVRQSIRSLLSDTKGRKRVVDTALALDADAAASFDTADLGTYLSQYGPYTAAGCDTPGQAGAYRIAAMDLRELARLVPRQRRCTIPRRSS